MSPGVIHLHNGRDNHIENNVFIDGKLQQLECNGWTGTSGTWKRHLPTMIEGYESVKGQAAWESMRNMETHPTEAVLPNEWSCRATRYLRNIVSYTIPTRNMCSSAIFRLTTTSAITISFGTLASRC